MKKIYKWLATLLLGVAWLNGWAQEPGCPSGSTCLTFDARMDLREAMNFDSDGNYGIVATNVPGINFSIRVDVFSKNEITWHHGLICTNSSTHKIFLFGGELRNRTAPNEFEIHPILENEQTGQIKQFDQWTKNLRRCWSSSTDWSNKVLKHNANLLYHKTKDQLTLANGGGFYAVKHVSPANVTIQVAIQGDVNFNEIDAIKIPGVDQDDIDDFLRLVKYTNPCTGDPTYAGCEAVADWKDVTGSEDKKTLVVAHRGYHGMRGVPENSLAAVQKAYDQKYRYTEVDIRRSKDNHPFIFHDDFLGYATDYEVLNNMDEDTHISSRNLAYLQSLRYRTRYWNGIYRTATNSSDKDVNARVGIIANTANVNSLAQIFDYINGKDIMLYLDIKDAATVAEANNDPEAAAKNNFKTMKECLKLAVKKNVLHQIAVKMIRTNDGAPIEKQYEMTVGKAEELMGAYYSVLKENLNVHIVDYKPQADATFIHDWIREGNVVGFEFDSNVSGWNAGTGKSFYQAPAFGDKIYIYNSNSVSAWEYTKLLGYRTGLWSSGPIDPRGRPGHDPSSWKIGGPMNRKISNDQHYADIRSRFEIQMRVSPQYITQDRPNIWVSYLEAVDQLNSKTFRP